MMHSAIEQMLARYDCRSQQDYINALKEIFQEIALLGLWRAKFFEKAAFYGGSALRILHGLDRFSEDLDFSLLKPEKDFDLSPFNAAIIRELQSFGFEVTVQTKIKTNKSAIESAFIKADAKTELIEISAPASVIQKTHRTQVIKIKLEVDTNPPLLFSTESQYLLQPIPFSINTFVLSSLFSGKVHALLCRPWVARIKGRDWYDFVWYVARNTPVNMMHLKQRLVQSGAWQAEAVFDKSSLLNLLGEKTTKTDFDQAKLDIIPFIDDISQLDIWSKNFFMSLLKKLKVS